MLKKNIQSKKNCLEKMLSEEDIAHIRAHWLKVKEHEDNTDLVRKKLDTLFKRITAFESKHDGFNCFSATSEEIELFLRRKKQSFEVFYKDFTVYKDLLEFQKEITEDMMTRYCRFLDDRDLRMDDDAYDDDLYMLVNGKPRS
jgi:hypothetical protein